MRCLPRGASRNRLTTRSASNGKDGFNTRGCAPRHRSHSASLRQTHLRLAAEARRRAQSRGS